MTDDATESEKPTLATYDGFLKTAMKHYYEKGGSKVNFLALLLASREAWEVAWGEATAPGTGKKILTGAAGAAAIVVILRLLVGGPIGILLTGASIASLGALYARNHKKIWAQRARYDELIDTYRGKHQGIRGKFVEGIVGEEERDLMLDGLLQRFLNDLDREPDLGEAEEEEAEESSEDEGSED